MSGISKRYAAALLDPSDLMRDFTSLAVSHAGSDEDAVSLARKEGAEWLLANGVKRAILHVVRGDHAFYSKPLTTTQ